MDVLFSFYRHARTLLHPRRLLLITFDPTHPTP